MVKLNFTWKEKTGKYQTGMYLYLNKICVADYGWNSVRSKSEADASNSQDYIGRIYLPSLKDTAETVYGSSPEEVKPKIEEGVLNWFNEALKVLIKEE